MNNDTPTPAATVTSQSDLKAGFHRGDAPFRRDRDDRDRRGGSRAIRHDRNRCLLRDDGPPALLACVNRAASIHANMRLGKPFCINLLASDHGPLSSAFGGKVRPEERFSLGLWQVDGDGPPYLSDAQANIFCVVDAVMDYGHPHNLHWQSKRGAPSRRRPTADLWRRTILQSLISWPRPAVATANANASSTCKCALADVLSAVELVGERFNLI